MKTSLACSPGTLPVLHHVPLPLLLCVQAQTECLCNSAVTQQYQPLTSSLWKQDTLHRLVVIASSPSLVVLEASSADLCWPKKHSFSWARWSWHSLLRGSRSLSVDSHTSVSWKGAWVLLLRACLNFLVGHGEGPLLYKTLSLSKVPGNP